MQQSGNSATHYTIETEHLTKVFGRFTAVDHIDIAVTAGEIYGFLGANGAGKTTAIRMLTGLLMPTGGTGHVAGFDIMNQTDKIRTRIGYMSQRFSLYGDLTVRDNLRLFGSFYGLSNANLKRRMGELSSFLGLTDLMWRTADSIPWGWQQRMSLACALLHEPRILFLDEPTGSVDPVSRRNFWDLLIQLAAQGTTVFITTHHMDEAEYCDRVSIMVDGRIAAVDTPRGLRQRTGAGSLQEAFVALVTAPGAA